MLFLLEFKAISKIQKYKKERRWLYNCNSDNADHMRLNRKKRKKDPKPGE